MIQRLCGNRQPPSRRKIHPILKSILRMPERGQCERWRLSLPISLWQNGKGTPLVPYCFSLLHDRSFATRAPYRLELKREAGKNRNGLEDVKNLRSDGVIRNDA